MSDNPEADEKFEAAINEYLAAQGYDDGLLIDWVLVTAQHIPHEDGSSDTAQAIHVSPRQALYRTVGLARYLVAITENRFAKLEDG